MAKKESNKQKAHRFRKIIIVLAVILVLAVIAIIVLAIYTGRAAAINPNTPTWSWNLGDTATWNNSYPASNPKCGQVDVTSGKYKLLFYNTDTSSHSVSVADANGNPIGEIQSVPGLTSLDNSNYFVILPGPGTYSLTNSVSNSGETKVFGKAYIKYPCSS